jgi:hypothetical protein
LSSENGSLLIHSATEKDEGYYLCEAHNGIGAGLSAVVFLLVNGNIICSTIVNNKCSVTNWGSNISTIKPFSHYSSTKICIWRKKGCSKERQYCNLKL